MHAQTANLSTLSGAVFTDIDHIVQLHVYCIGPCQVHAEYKIHDVQDCASITWQVTSSASAQYRSYMYSSVAQLVVVDLDNSDQLAFLQLFICGLHGFQLALFHQ